MDLGAHGVENVEFQCTILPVASNIERPCARAQIKSEQMPSFRKLPWNNPDGETRRDMVVLRPQWASIHRAARFRSLPERRNTHSQAGDDVGALAGELRKTGDAS